MAWTNIHDEFLARNKHVSLALMMCKEYAGWDEMGARALGQISFLWGNSQADKKTEGSAEDIILWSQLYQAAEDPGYAGLWIRALCHPTIGILRQIGDDKFEIVGNTKGIEYRHSQKEKSMLGGQKNKEKWEKIRAGKRDSLGLSGGLSAGIAKGNEIKGNEIKISKKERKPVFDFEKPYSEYPLKKGKDAGFRRLASRITTLIDYEKFCRAVRKYASECKLQRTDPKYIKHFSTFVGTDDNEPWRDFAIDPPVNAEPRPLNRPTELDNTPLTPEEVAKNKAQFAVLLEKIGAKKVGT